MGHRASNHADWNESGTRHHTTSNLDLGDGMRGSLDGGLQIGSHIVRVCCDAEESNLEGAHQVDAMSVGMEHVVSATREVPEWDHLERPRRHESTPLVR